MTSYATMRYGKVVRLNGVPLVDRFEILYGLECDSGQGIFNFGTISLNNPSWSNIYIKTGVIVTNRGDGFTDILILNGQLEPDEVEQFILVIIPNATQLVTNVQKIAGRYPNEAVLCMHAGDTVEVSKTHNGQRTVYMAVQAGNELFLIKKER